MAEKVLKEDGRERAKAWMSLSMNEGIDKRGDEIS